MLHSMKQEKQKRLFSILTGAMLFVSSVLFIFVTGTWMTKPSPGTFAGFHSYIATLEASTLGEPKAQQTEIALNIVHNNFLRYLPLILSIIIIFIGEFKLTNRLLTVFIYSSTAICILWFTVFILFSLMIPYVKIIYQ